MNEEKMYNCHKCEKVFKHSGSRDRHVTEMHENRQFQCPLCLHSSKRRDDLITHYQKVHGNAPLTPETTKRKPTMPTIIDPVAKKRRISRIPRRSPVKPAPRASSPATPPRRNTSKTTTTASETISKPPDSDNSQVELIDPNRDAVVVLHRVHKSSAPIPQTPELRQDLDLTLTPETPCIDEPSYLNEDPLFPLNILPTTERAKNPTISTKTRPTEPTEPTSKTTVLQPPAATTTAPPQPLGKTSTPPTTSTTATTPTADEKKQKKEKKKKRKNMSSIAIQTVEPTYTDHGTDPVNNTPPTNDPTNNQPPQQPTNQAPQQPPSPPRQPAFQPPPQFQDQPHGHYQAPPPPPPQADQFHGQFQPWRRAVANVECYIQ